MSMKDLIKKVLKEDTNKKMILTEQVIISENMKYHLNEGIRLQNQIFRPYSDEFFNLINEARDLYNEGKLQLEGFDKWIVSMDIGKTAINEDGDVVFLDVPFLDEDEMINEAEYAGKTVKLNYPMRASGGKKKYYVYVKGNSGRVKKISFGDVHGGLTAKVSNPEARRSFAARHKCKDKKDKTKAGYWACRINRYAHLWGGKTYGGYW